MAIIRSTHSHIYIFRGAHICNVKKTNRNIIIIAYCVCIAFVSYQDSFRQKIFFSFSAVFSMLLLLDFVFFLLFSMFFFSLLCWVFDRFAAFNVCIRALLQYVFFASTLFSVFSCCYCHVVVLSSIRSI